MSHQALDQVKDELTRLVTENEQLKSQLQGQTALEVKVGRLEEMVGEYRKITNKFAQLAKKHHEHTSAVPNLYVSYFNFRYCPYQKRHEEQWLHWFEQELEFAKEARAMKWKEETASLKSQLERQRHETQASTETANSTTAHLKRKYKSLEEQIH